MIIDVICLTYTKDESFYELTKQTLDTLLLTKGGYIFNIKLMESNIDSNFIYDYPNLQVITPNEKFNYNRFLNIGLTYCNSDWVLIINNDLKFTEDWLNNIMIEYSLNNNIQSFSPFEPDFVQNYYDGLFHDGNVFLGYTPCVELYGWCVLVKKEVLDLINGFDEQFVFYYQDNDYGLTLQKYGINHALIKNSVVYHLMSKSHNLMSEEEYKYNTQTMGRLFSNKWEIKNNKMRITQVTPGVIPIPPNGWGAVEKILWCYHNEFNSLGHECTIKYLNEASTDNSDIIHIHIANLALDAAERGVPYIFSLHDHHVVHYGKDSFNYRQNLEAIQKSVISFCHAEYLVDYFEGTDKLFYLSHGVEVDYFKVDNLYREEHKLLCIANNGIGGDSSFDRKGFRYAIESAKKLNLPITIAGPENNKLFFQHHPDLLEYEKLTLLLTNLSEDEILELYKSHSIFLHPSILEAGHPNLTLLEAVSCGLPVVGTYEGSQKIDGMIISERNSDLVANAISEIINQYKHYVDLTQNNRTKFDWTTICKRMVKMYEVVTSIKKEYSSEETKNLFIKNFNNITKTMGLINSNNQNVKPDVKYNFHFVNQPFFEILGDSDKKFNVEFYDSSGLHHHTELSSNMWTKVSREYFTNWYIKVSCDNDIVFEYNLDLTNRRVFISFESSSLGDSIAWIPYVLEFKKQHNCIVIVSTFWNKLFKKSYPELEFIEPGSTVHNLFALYRIGWFENETKEPFYPNTIPLQKTITNLLKLEHSEIKATLDFTPKVKPMVEKYITIADESTAGLKLWNNPKGWQELIDYLTGLGYKIINISKHGGNYKNVTKLKDTSIENTMNYIHHSEFFIGLSSGLSWLSWALGKHVVMISNFTESDHEFTTNCTRITNDSVCNGCWNKSEFRFDRGDWNWCPENKGTPRQFECHKSITSEMVIKQIQHLL
jgi:autotransporter strand-loop-strand O-heptosyltransferase